MGLLLPGLLLTVCALAAAVYAVVAAPVARVPLERRTLGRTDEKPVLTLTSDYLVTVVDRFLRQASWVPFRARELDLAGVKVTPGALVLTVVLMTFAALAFLLVLTGSLPLALLFAVLVPVLAKVGLKIKTGRRRKAFAAQLDETIQIIASALRAGHSFPRALDAVATEADSPTAEEFARIINENRIGRDFVVALEQTADRMDNSDFRWIAEAVAVHRDTGGNLNEVLDQVGSTMRERNQVRQQVDSLAAEGKFSALILMALPIIVGLAYVVVNPDYMSLLATTSTGRLMLGVSVLLYLAGGLWMKAVVKVKF